MNNNRLVVKERLYIGTKIITARPMEENVFLRLYRGQSITPDSTTKSRPGYKVTYPDGYESWSPKETFETAYREVTEAERTLF